MKPYSNSGFTSDSTDVAPSRPAVPNFNQHDDDKTEEELPSSDSGHECFDACEFNDNDTQVQIWVCQGEPDFGDGSGIYTSMKDDI